MPTLYDLRVAEYSALRAEILTLIGMQSQVVNFSVALTGVVLGLFAKKEGQSLIPYLPIPYVLFGMLYGDTTFKILRAAHYISAVLRPKLDTCAGSTEYWEWEQFIRGKLGTQPVVKGFLLSGDAMRMAFFALPASLSTIVGIYLQFSEHHCDPWSMLILCVIDVPLVVYLLHIYREIDRSYPAVLDSNKTP